MITFADYMDRMLYGPAGYYSTGVAKSGRSGDYFTAPDVGPVFGQLLAEMFMNWREKLGAKDFTLVEAGAGEGRLAKDIIASFRRKPESSPDVLDPGFRRGDDKIRYVAIERSPVRRQILASPHPNPLPKGEGDEARVRQSLEVYEDLSAVPFFEGVLFANELIDAFPVHRVQFKNGELRELFIDESKEKRRFVWGAPSTPNLQSYVDRLQLSFPDGYETEVNLAMSEWLAGVSRVMQKGLVVLIDYGRPAHEYYAPERNRGTLRAFSKHRVSADFLDPSGMVDLTADVDFTSLSLDAKAAGFTPLAFMELGTLLLQGVALMKDPNVLSKGGLKYLIHPEGMGSAFHVLVLGKGVNAADWIFEHNRLSRL